MGPGATLAASFLSAAVRHGLPQRRSIFDLSYRESHQESIVAFVYRLSLMTDLLGIEDISFKMALVLIDRLLGNKNSPVHELTHWNIHRIFLSAFIVASKFHQDLFLCNSFFVPCGYRVADVNIMERGFLSYVDFRIFISLEELLFFVGYCRRKCASLEKWVLVPQIHWKAVAPVVKAQGEDEDGYELWTSSELG